MNQLRAWHRLQRGRFFADGLRNGVCGGGIDAAQVELHLCVWALRAAEKLYDAVLLVRAMKLPPDPMARIGGGGRDGVEIAEPIWPQVLRSLDKPGDAFSGNGMNGVEAEHSARSDRALPAVIVVGPEPGGAERDKLRQADGVRLRRFDVSRSALQVAPPER